MDDSEETADFPDIVHHIERTDACGGQFQGEANAGRNWERGRSAPGRGRNGAAAARRVSVPSRPRSIPVAICMADSTQWI